MEKQICIHKLGQRPQLCDNGMQFRLLEINGIKDYFTAEIREKETMSKTLGLHVAALNYFDKNFLVLSAANDGVSIASFAVVIGAPVEITSASLILIIPIPWN